MVRLKASIGISTHWYTWSINRCGIVGIFTMTKHYPHFQHICFLSFKCISKDSNNLTWLNLSTVSTVCGVGVPIWLKQVINHISISYFYIIYHISLFIISYMKLYISSHTYCISFIIYHIIIYHISHTLLYIFYIMSYIASCICIILHITCDTGKLPNNHPYSFITPGIYYK